MFNDLQGLNLFPTTTADIIVNIIVALICSLFIAWLYRRTQQGPGYSANFAHSIVLLSMITALVIMVIGNNLARAFGLVGAMSIIRFRTAVKETRDIIFIFFGLAVGMAAGVGYHRLAILGALVIGLIVYLLSKAAVGVPQKREYLLQFFYTPNGDTSPPYLSVMDKHCRHHKVINVRSSGASDTLELAYYVQLRQENRSNEFISELKHLRDLRGVSLFFDEEKF
ncbi:MAG TPA: DUF4956 domain-containing protein [candidate division Zixibacteria bacterium]|nr:DUF4956 domain-containing protein [candidate division Zixibacteria bacterium]